MEDVKRILTSVEDLKRASKSSEAQTLLEREMETMDEGPGLAVVLSELAQLRLESGNALGAQELFQRAVLLRDQHGEAENSSELLLGSPGEPDAEARSRPPCPWVGTKLPEEKLACRTGRPVAELAAAGASAATGARQEPEDDDWEALADDDEQDWEKQADDSQRQSDPSQTSAGPGTLNTSTTADQSAATVGAGAGSDDDDWESGWEESLHTLKPAAEVLPQQAAASGAGARSRAAPRAPAQSSAVQPSGSGRARGPAPTSREAPLVLSYEHVLEIVGVSAAVSDVDLERWLKRLDVSDLTIMRRVNSRYALALFPTPRTAYAALNMDHPPPFSLGPFSMSSPIAALVTKEDLQPPIKRRETTSVAARRMIANALNMREIVKTDVARKEEAELTARRKANREARRTQQAAREQAQHSVWND